MTSPQGPEDVVRPSAPNIIGEGDAARLPAGRPFESYMAEPLPGQTPTAGTQPMQVSPFDLAQGQIPAAGPNFNTIQAQAINAQSALGDVANQLNTPNLKLRQSSKYILKNKLSSANAHIRSATSKLGIPPQPAPEVPEGAGPIQRFLSYVTDGQNQLQAAQAQIHALQSKGESFNPADMLLIQIKINKAQQEIEYSSVLLSKAVDDMKMMMNIQL